MDKKSDRVVAYILSVGRIIRINRIESMSCNRDNCFCSGLSFVTAICSTYGWQREKENFTVP